MSTHAVATAHAKDAFDNPHRRDADVILRTKDNIDFYVHKFLLSLASEFFEGMFSVPQPPGETEQRPIISVEERSAIIDPLLRFIYPCVRPQWRDPEIVLDVLEAARKYDVQHAVVELKMIFESFATRDPLRTWAAACRKNLEDEAQMAAQKWRENTAPMTMVELYDLAHSYDTLHDMPAGIYSRLLHSRVTGKQQPFCVAASRESTSDDELPPMTPPTEETGCDFTWITTDGVNFPLRSEFVRSLPALFRRCLPEELRHGSKSAGGCKDTLPTATFPERSAILRPLLACYHVPDPDQAFADLGLSYRHARAVLQAAKVKFELPEAVGVIQQWWWHIVVHDKDYVSAALYAAQKFGPDEARKAACVFALRCVAEEKVDQPALVTPDCEEAPARFYNRLYRVAKIIREKALATRRDPKTLLKDHLVEDLEWAESCISWGIWKRMSFEY